MKLLTFPVKVEDGSVFLDLPPISELDQVGYRLEEPRRCRVDPTELPHHGAVVWIVCFSFRWSHM